MGRKTGRFEVAIAKLTSDTKEKQIPDSLRWSSDPWVRTQWILCFKMRWWCAICLNEQSWNATITCAPALRPLAAWQPSHEVRGKNGQREAKNPFLLFQHVQRRKLSKFDTIEMQRLIAFTQSTNSRLDAFPGYEYLQPCTHLINSLVDWLLPHPSSSYFTLRHQMNR